MYKTLGLVALSMLTGCLRTSGDWEGIWFIQVPPASTVDCETDIDENFKDAQVPEDQVVDGPWTYEETFEGSDSGFFMQVLVQNGNTFGIIDDVVYVGTADAKTLTLNWEGFEESDESAEHEEGYRFELVETGTTSETITLTKGEKHTYAGTFDFALSTEAQYIEDDEWVAADVGFGTGDVPGYLLEGDVTENGFDTDDCSGDECEITVTTTCNSSQDITASFVGKHNEGMYSSVEDATRAPGVESY